jgi:transposase
VPVHRDLTDAQWALWEPFFASPPARPDGRGRPWTNTRAVRNAVFLVLRPGCTWADWPRTYPPRSTGPGRFPWWIQAGALAAALNERREALRPAGLLELRECFIDGSFAPTKRGGLAVGKTKKGKGSKLMAVVEAPGRPLAVTLESATPQEVTLLDQRWEARLVDPRPHRLLGDKAYDADALEATLAPNHVEMMAPHRSSRKHRPPEGPPLRRRERRWKVERYFAWLPPLRRVLLRWEGKPENDLGFVPFASWLILLRQLT